MSEIEIEQPKKKKRKVFGTAKVKKPTYMILLEDKSATFEDNFLRYN